MGRIDLIGLLDLNFFTADSRGITRIVQEMLIRVHPRRTKSIVQTQQAAFLRIGFPFLSSSNGTDNHQYKTR